ncbi:MAG: class I tRNA ligase family protein, partial [Aquabacterium sp.]|nr:class I tRNA ligase family protein [Aquabacterium sp.]
FVKRVWNFGARNVEALKAAGKVVQSELSAEAKALRREVFVVLKQISYDYERMQYNTVASGAMKLLNALEAHKGATPADQAVLREGYGILLRGLYPACPHLTHVLWQDLGYAAQDNMGDLLDAPWPVVIEEALVQDEIELMLQVNGKLRGSIKVSPHADKAAIEAAALASEDFAKFSEGKAPKKVIVVPGRLVNLVV